MLESEATTSLTPSNGAKERLSTVELRQGIDEALVKNVVNRSRILDMRHLATPRRFATAGHPTAAADKRYKPRIFIRPPQSRVYTFLSGEEKTVTANTVLRLSSSVRAIAMSGLIGLAIPGEAAAISYTFQQIDVPGAQGTFVYDINDTGQIVGDYTDASGRHGFVFDGSTYITLDYPSAGSTSAFGINDAGQIVGSYDDGQGGPPGAFLLDDSSGPYTSLMFPGAEYTSATGINDAGDITGAIITGGILGFLFDGTTWSSFEYPGGSLTRPEAINDAGQIVGVYWSGSSDHAFLKDGTTFTTISIPGPGGNMAYGINDLGQIVGVKGSQAFVGSAGSYTLLDFPGAKSTAAYGINEAGQIVGRFLTSTGAVHGFIAIPVPEPSTFALTAGGLASLLMWRRTRSRFKAAASPR